MPKITPLHIPEGEPDHTNDLPWPFGPNDEPPAVPSPDPAPELHPEGEPDAPGSPDDGGVL
ncbi:MAG: hypothetical protein U1F43_00475 [Myxococcota bacterium]